MDIEPNSPHIQVNPDGKEIPQKVDKAMFFELKLHFPFACNLKSLFTQTKRVNNDKGPKISYKELMFAPDHLLRDVGLQDGRARRGTDRI